MELVIKAGDFAARKHADQRRKDATKTPYINHPIEVAYLLTLAGIMDTQVLCAGLLHDVLEDTTTSYHELETVFGTEITDIVMECTDNKSLHKVDRKKLQISKAPHKSDKAKLVKLADKLSNLSTLADNPPSTWTKEEIRGYFIWSFMVCRQVKGCNRWLDDKLNVIFNAQGIDKLSDEELESELNKYYEYIKCSE